MVADLVVGIDVGMSGTGVAYRLKGNQEAKYLLWGSSMSEKKVPTRLFYSVHDQPPKLLGWGYDAPSIYDEGINVQEWFKTSLGDDDDDQTRMERLYTDYLGCLYQELTERRFTSAMLGGHQLGSIAVQFLFSVPATWNPAVVDTFKRLVLDAGFGGHNNHTIAVTMTEPEAVAAYEICKPDGDLKLQDDDTVLIVDAGGGTGDFCLLAIKEDQNGNSQANELQPVTGSEIGSTYIDSDFESLVASVLEPQQTYLSKSFKDVAWEMRNSRAFQEKKHKFGTADPRNHGITIPHLRESKSDSESCWLQNGLAFTKDDMANLFDRQITSMQKYITEFVDCCKTYRGTTPATRLDYIILAGGLGSSDYVLHRVKEYCANAQARLSNKTKVVKSSEPRLSVCMGLVYHAGRNPGLFPRPCHRASFGIASQIPAGSCKQGRFRRYLERITKERPRASKHEDHIDWFIKKGTQVPDSGFHAYKQTAVFSPDKLPSKRIWEIGIFTSLENDPAQVEPQDNIHLHTIIRVDLSRVAQEDVRVRKEKRAKLRFGKKSDVETDFIVEAEVGLAAVNFQCFDLKKSKLLSEPVKIDTEE